MTKLLTSGLTEAVNSKKTNKNMLLSSAVTTAIVQEYPRMLCTFLSLPGLTHIQEIYTSCSNNNANQYFICLALAWSTACSGVPTSFLLATKETTLLKAGVPPTKSSPRRAESEQSKQRVHISSK